MQRKVKLGDDICNTINSGTILTYHTQVPRTNITHHQCQILGPITQIPSQITAQKFMSHQLLSFLNKQGPSIEVCSIFLHHGP